ncbi:MAG: radical SAM protein, partial [Vicinamibacteria bacterium]
MHRPIKYAEKALTYTANGVWFVFEKLNRIRPRPSFTPSWSEKPLLKSWQKTKPTLGWPRTTDSLCPKCIPEARDQILNGDGDYKVFINEKVGEIKAQIIERDGKI